MALIFRILRALALVSLLFTVPRAGMAQDDNTYCAPDQTPTYAFAFADLKAAVGDPMGDPLTCEYGDPEGTGDVLQATTTGMAVWRASSSTPIFTAGSDHWAIVASGPVSWSGPGLDPPADLVASPPPPPSQASDPVVQVAAPAAAPVPAASDPGLSSASSIYWGSYISNVPAGTAQLDAFEAAIGKKESIVHWGQAWHYASGFGEFQTSRYDAVRNRGSIPMVDWGSWDYSLGLSQPDFQLARIASGSYDAFITQWAQAARAWGQPFFLRFDPEMNGNWLPWSEQINGNHPGEFVAAWRHVHDIFVQQGATNATWVWCPNISSNKTAPIPELYPGDAYVDWTCLDGYNWGTDEGNQWQSFSQVFSGTGPGPGSYNPHNSYQEMLALAPSKPIMLGEVASSENGGSKAIWVSDMLRTLPAAFPQIKAMVWMDWNIGDPKLSWPLESSRQAMAAFASGIASPTYAANEFRSLVGGPIPPLSGVAQAPPNPIVDTPLADTYTSRGSPNSTAPGVAATLSVDASGTDTTFLLFDLSALGGKTIKSATLRLHTSGESWAGSGAAADVKLVSATNWKEEYMTFRNTVPISNTILGTFPSAKQPNTWYETSLTTGEVQARTGGMLAVAISMRSGDVWLVNSRESGAGTAPQLVLAY